MCRVFPSSLGPMAMRWFDRLRTNSVSSFRKLTQSFCSRFITCSKVPQPLDSLLSMSMREGESVKVYFERYWEMFNEINGDFDEVVIKTFKVGLPSEHDLRKSLTNKPVTSLRQLMDWVDKYKRIEDDQQQGKGKAKVIPQDMRDFRSDRYNNNRPRRDYTGQSGSTIFRQLIQCSENRSGKFWRRLRTNHSSNGQIKWLETLQRAIKTSIAITIRNKDILRKIVGICEIIWTNLSERAN